MKEIALEILTCLIAASLLMVLHELIKSVIYIIVRGKNKHAVKGTKKIWYILRYIDPVGLILAVTCQVPVSKPYLFRIRDKKTNTILGITGFATLIAMFILSILVLKSNHHYLLNQTIKSGYFIYSLSLFWQYMSILSFGMFIANLFPISTFDMGLLIAGVWPKYYLRIIKMDSVIKLILMLTLILDIIHYGCIKFLGILF